LAGCLDGLLDQSQNERVAINLAFAVSDSSQNGRDQKIDAYDDISDHANEHKGENERNDGPKDQRDVHVKIFRRLILEKWAIRLDEIDHERRDDKHENMATSMMTARL
jgi:hypothetical protein